MPALGTSKKAKRPHPESATGTEAPGQAVVRIDELQSSIRLRCEQIDRCIALKVQNLFISAHSVGRRLTLKKASRPDHGSARKERQTAFRGNNSEGGRSWGTVCLSVMQLCVGDNAPSACAAAWVVMGRHQKALPGTALSRRVRSFSARSIACRACDFNPVPNRCRCKRYGI